MIGIQEASEQFDGIIPVSIFPDEFEDGEYQQTLMGIQTRSGKRLSGVITPPRAAKNKSKQGNENQEPSTAPQNQQPTLGESLQEWKRNSRLFAHCKRRDCDPFGKFLFHQRICHKCRSIRDGMRRKFILLWKAKELHGMLVNSAYFHVIKIFDPQADQHYAREKPDNPYFLAYSRLRKANKFLLDNFLSASNIPFELQSAANRSLMSFEFVDSRKQLSDMGLSVSCEICHKESSTLFLKYFRIFTFSGPRYNKNNFEIRQETASDGPDNFLLCPYHARHFKTFYHLKHMDWNVHWNCRLRVSQQLIEKPDSTAEEVMNALNPENVADSYSFLYRKFDYGEADRTCFSENYNSETLDDKVGFHIWRSLRIQLKDEAIFQKIATNFKTT